MLSMCDNGLYDNRFLFKVGSLHSPPPMQLHILISQYEQASLIAVCPSSLAYAAKYSTIIYCWCSGQSCRCYELVLRAALMSRADGVAFIKIRFGASFVRKITEIASHITELICCRKTW